MSKEEFMKRYKPKNKIPLELKSKHKDISKEELKKEIKCPKCKKKMVKLKTCFWCGNCLIKWKETK